jgi:hypothetical protein
VDVTYTVPGEGHLPLCATFRMQDRGLGATEFKHKGWDHPLPWRSRRSDTKSGLSVKCIIKRIKYNSNAEFMN